MAPNLLLESYNRIVYARVLEKLTTEGGIKKGLKEKLADFNQSIWFIERTKEKMTISVATPCWNQLKENRAMEFLQKVYGADLVEADSNSEYNLILTIPEKHDKPEEFAMSAAKLLTNMLIGPAVVLADEVKNNKAAEKLIQIDYRPGESYWLKPNGDRLTVIFSIKFDDRDDAVFGRVFINEFSKSAPGCPSCDVVTRKNSPPPSELKTVEGLAEDNCYISFLLEKRHLNNPQKTLEILMSCRNYINFHIKCSKAFLHIRMRNKVSHLQLVLNRAKPEREVEKKTASGRTFKK
ncbi:hypothetical protein, conserved [Entamoeba dispar SAW760]|uniref:Arp2/3 complex 34 kDa subunit n=1 Tax=Entamoeba dispar (strain ATCC PRA-260 / SAW760) TaxID=370354 RepID=B0EKJ6_ENTDS|nr:uncharacterized protein EDI_015750 [Entamoeba dispar SAW760]EDR24947.1 hypothetical protein, conserved [Entamoeba dispar SAW760]|eukprot:EDR24947.1 hypothetical protein, conserved [Entamoeba dispar SAW760]